MLEVKMKMGRLFVEKSALLRNLKAELEKTFKGDLWLFPRGNSEKAVRYFEKDLGKGVMGFWGTGEKSNSDDVIMIVAERPSAGRQNKPKEFDKTLARFYGFLEKKELSNSHVTDFIKTRARTGYDWKKPQKLEFYEKEFDQHLPFLKKELDIIKPNKIIALGEKTYLWVAICKSFFKLKEVELFHAPHYANRFKKQKEFEKEFLTSIDALKHT